jgi:hypothetical protein
MLLEEESPAYGDGSGRASWIRLACDNRASAQPIPQIRDLSSFLGSRSKVEGPSVFHGDREGQLRFLGFAPFVKSVRRNKATPLSEGSPKRGGFVGSCVDGLGSDLGIFRPVKPQILQGVFRRVHAIERWMKRHSPAQTQNAAKKAAPEGTIKQWVHCGEF